MVFVHSGPAVKYVDADTLTKQRRNINIGIANEQMSRKMGEKREEERYGEEERAGVAGHGHSLSLTTAAFICGGNTARRE